MQSGSNLEAKAIAGKGIGKQDGIKEKGIERRKGILRKGIERRKGILRKGIGEVLLGDEAIFQMEIKKGIESVVMTIIIMDAQSRFTLGFNVIDLQLLCLVIFVLFKR